MNRDSATTFIGAFVQWASTQPDIVAVALVGSHACGAATAESDVDLVILTSQSSRYLSDPAWVRTFGVVTHQRVEPYGRLTSLRVHYDDGVEVEYGLTDPAWAMEPLDPGTRDVLAGGMLVLVERRPVFSLLKAATNL